MALISALTDDFNDLSIGAQWELGLMTDIGMAGGSVSVTEAADGTLQIYPTSSNYRGVVSVAAYDMTGGGEVTVKALRGTNNAQSYVGLCVGDYSSEWARICTVGNSMEVNSGVDNSWGSVSGEQSGWVASLGTWQYWRIKENAGDLDFYTSPDGATWTFRVSYTTPTWDLSATHVSLEAGQWGAGGEVITRFDDLNILGPVPITGTGAPTIGKPALAATGTNFANTGALTIGPPVLAASGTIVLPPVSGDGAITIGKPVVTAGENIPFVNRNQPGISEDINNPSGNFGYNTVVVDPNNDNIVYFGTNRQGIWKSTNAGDTWALISGGAGPVGDASPQTMNTGANWALTMDPYNGAIYTSSGHNAHGVWKSTDGGVTWVDKLDNAKATATGLDTRDVYTIDCDPWLENHLLCTFHYYWSGGPSGIIESYNGGDTWTKINPTGVVPWGHNNMAWFGNDSNTVMIGMQDDGGVWITRNHFSSYSQITTTSMTHGAVTALTRAQDNTMLIALSAGSVLRSTDDGTTWVNIGANLTNSYDNVACDGTSMWTCPINTGDDPLMTKPLHAAAATNWTVYGPHPQNPITGEKNGPVHSAYSQATRRVFTVNWRAGLFMRVGVAPSAVLGGTQPNATGALTYRRASVRALPGAQPYPTGILAKRLSTQRGLSSAQPYPTGLLARRGAIRTTVAGAQFSGSGVLARVQVRLRALTGAQPTALGALIGRLRAVRGLDGAQALITGLLERRSIINKPVVGAQPGAGGALSVSQSIPGPDLPIGGPIDDFNDGVIGAAWTGISIGNFAIIESGGRLNMVAVDPIPGSGNLTTNAGYDLTNRSVRIELAQLPGAAATADFAIGTSMLGFSSSSYHFGWEQGDMAASFRGFTEGTTNLPDRPWPSGARWLRISFDNTASNKVWFDYSANGIVWTAFGNLPIQVSTTLLYVQLSGDAPGPPSGTASWDNLNPVPLRIAGSQQPAAGGALTTRGTFRRPLVGAQAYATALLALVSGRGRVSPGAQPTSSGILSRLKQGVRAFTSLQPAAGGQLAVLAAKLRLFTGAQGSPSGLLQRSLAVPRLVVGAQPAPTASLAKSRLRVLVGAQPTATSSVLVASIRYRSFGGTQPNPGGRLLFIPPVMPPEVDALPPLLVGTAYRESAAQEVVV